MVTNEDLATQLLTGVAECPIEGRPKIARARLMGAATAMGKRITVRRDHDRDVLIATVLGAEEAAAQAKRTAVFRAVNEIRRAVEILENELLDPEEFADDRLDLVDIADDLEESVKNTLTADVA